MGDLIVTVVSSGPDHHALARHHFFFDGTPIEADKPLVIEPTGAVAGSCFFFGFLVSRLPRLCSLAMMSSWSEPSFRVGICEKQKAPRPYGEGRRVSPQVERSAASFVSSRRYIHGRLSRSTLAPRWPGHGISMDAGAAIRSELRACRPTFCRSCDQRRVRSPPSDLRANR